MKLSPVYWNADNVDTDQLIPARFMRRRRHEGYGDQLLYDVRRDDLGDLIPNHPVNQTGGDTLVVGRNFGCGSSREAAVYALVDAGFKIIIAESFGDIFRNNATNNRLMTFSIDPTDLAQLHAAKGELTIDLERLRLNDRIQLLAPDDMVTKVRAGHDLIDETLVHQSSIDQFISQYTPLYDAQLLATRLDQIQPRQAESLVAGTANEIIWSQK